MEIPVIKFGTDGIRGIIDKELNEYVIALVTEATLRYWSSKFEVNKVFIGYDTRFKSKDYALIIGNIAYEHGLDVLISSEPIPTPVVSWIVKNYKFDLAFQVTASHNPPEYNGIKIIDNHGASISDEISKGIEEVLYKEYRDIVKSIETIQFKPLQIIDLRNEYIEYVINELTSKFKPSKKLKIVVDPMYGTTIKYTPEILKKLDFEVKIIHGEYDPLFKGLIPNPEPENLEELKKIIHEYGFDLGIAHDGDGDRVTIYHPKLQFLTGNDICVLLTYVFAKSRFLKKGVARTIATTHLIDEICKDFNVNVFETPVGIKYIAELLIKNEIDLGGEESGGIAFNWHIPEKDGIYTGTLISILHSNQDIENVINEIWSKYGKKYFKRIDIKYEKAREVLKQYFNEILESLKKLKTISRILTIDGIKIVYNDSSWILIRASGTEKAFRIYVESYNQEDLDKMIDYVKNQITKYLS